MEFRLKLMKVMEKSWNFVIMAKSHGKVMEFDKRILHIYKSPTYRFHVHSVRSSWNCSNKFLIEMNWHRYTAAFQNPTDVYVD